MATAELSRRVRKVVDYPPLVDMDDRQRHEFHDALPDAGSFTPSLALFAQSSSSAYLHPYSGSNDDRGH